MSVESQSRQVGLVVYADGNRFTVWNDGQTIPCALRGRLKREWLRVTSLVVTGDWVTFTPAGDGTGVIEEVQPRQTKLSRPGFAGYEHVIAANIELLCIVASVYSPPFKRNVVDRFLVAARQGGMTPLLMVNKADLVDERTVDAWLQPLRETDLTIVRTSAVSGLGLEALRKHLAGRVSVLAGQSGVGKTSLLNALYPGFNLRTQTVSVHQKGRHTTTSSRLYPLPDGGFLADTPGIKSLALWETDDADLGAVFPEIESLAACCKFRDCSHTHEPGCAVKIAVDQGALDEGRYRNYVRLHKGH